MLSLVCLCDRPSYLIIGETSTEKQSLIKLTEQFREGLGLVFVGDIEIGSFATLLNRPLSRRSSFSDLFESDAANAQQCPAAEDERRVSELTQSRAPTEGPCREKIMAPSYVEGVQILLQTTGIDGLRPNTLLMTYPRTNNNVEVVNFANVLHSAARMHYAIGVLRGDVQVPEPESKGTIDVWWLADTGGITMLLSHLLRQHPEWSSCRIRVFLHGQSGEFHEHEASMVRLMKLFRIDVSHIEHANLFQEPHQKSWEIFEDDELSQISDAQRTVSHDGFIS